jgi:hypothetical protein
MAEDEQPYDAGSPDAVETDPAALSSAEDLDEDRLRLDPLEAGMDPPEHWTAADKYGTTPWEQAHPPALDDRLAEEQPDTPAPPGEPSDQEPGPTDELPAEFRDYDEELGTSADVAGGSMAREIRTPEGE